MHITKLVAAAALVALTGCATAPMGADYQPIVDLKGTEPAKYQADLQQCQSLARQANSAANQAVAGAIAGALLMAAIAPRDYRQGMANRGALLGAASGGANAVETQQTIIRRCLTGRGYSVLN